MAKRRLNFQALKQADCAYVVEYLQSKSNGAAMVQEIKYLCRRMNMSGMAETIIDWLEQAGVIRYEREIDAIYLVRPGKTAPPAATAMPTPESARATTVGETE